MDDDIDDQSIASLQRQTSTSTHRIDFIRWQSQHEADDDDQKLFSLAQWWAKRGRESKHLEKDKAWVLEKLLEELTPSPEIHFGKTDEAGRTVLHLALLHRMPQQFILFLMDNATQSPLAIDCEDEEKLRPIDYLLDWEDLGVSNKILKKFAQSIDLSEGRNCPMCKHPLVRICRKAVGDCLLPELLGRLNTSQDFKNKMLEEAVKRGSSSTVEYLLKTGADATCTSHLLHVAAGANHDSLDKVFCLIQYGKLDASQVNAEGLTLVHVAADGKPPRIDLLNYALKAGVNPNTKDLIDGDTALHKVTRNHRERTIPWKESEQAMELLLQHPQIKPNIQNSRGLTPLGILMTARSTLSVDLFWKWVQANADFTGGSHESDLKKGGLQCPLATMSCRPNGDVLIGRLIQHLGVDKLQGYLKYMLEAAVEKGTEKTVEMLLDKGADAKEDDGRLLMIAARSKTEAGVKLVCLKNKGANPEYIDAKWFSVLHTVAQSDTATETVLKVCTNTLLLGVGLKDRSDNTPLHIAAKNTHSCSEMVFENLLGRKPTREDPGARNKTKQSPFQLVLQYNHSNKELRRNKLILLLKNGYKPTKEDFDDYKGDAEDFEELFLSTEVFTRSYEPFQFLLVLAKYCDGLLAPAKSVKSSARPNFTKNRQWRNVNAKIEAAAVMIIEELGKDRWFVGCELTNAYLQEVHKMGWNKFLANKYVGKILERKFYGQVEVGQSNSKESWRTFDPGTWSTVYRLPGLVGLFLLQCLLLPFFLLIMACCYGNNCGKNIRKLYIDPRRLPIVTFYSSMVGYIAFLGFLIARIVCAEDSPQKSFSWFDWVLLLYLVAMLAEEAYQMKKYKHRYVTITNGCDCAMILCFGTYLILRVIGNATDNLQAYRFSEGIFAVAVALSFLRLLYYMQVNHNLGPILFSFKAIWAEVVSFMAILGVVLLAFGAAVTVVYNGGVYTDQFQNGGIYLPPEVRGLWPSLQTMYWSLYGQIQYDTLDDGDDAIRPETTFGLILFALWSLVSVIVLLNMLIALINEAFDRVKKQNSDLVWNLAVNDIITDIEELPSFPLPMNLFCIAASVFKIDDCLKRKYKEDGHETTTRQSWAKDSFKQRVKEEGKEERTTQNLESVGKLERQIKSLKTKLSRGIKMLRYETKQRLSKQTKRVQALLRPVHGPTGDEPDCTDRELWGDNSDLDIGDPDSDSDSDMDEDEQFKVRCERVRFGSSEPVSISYEGNNGKVSGCQFLNRPLSSTFKYFEVKVVDYGRDGSIGIGLAHRSYPLNRMPGLRKGSVAFHCDSGRLFYENGKGTNKASPAQQGDVIGCGIKSYLPSNGIEDGPIVFFTRNGEELASMKVTLPRRGFFPIVGLRSDGEKVEINWSVEWKSPAEDVEGDEQSGMAQNEKRMRLPSITSISPDCDLADDLADDHGIKSDRDATRRSPDGQTSRSKLIDVIGNNLLKRSDKPSGNGVYQFLIRPMSPEFSYYEVTVKNYGTEGAIAVGLARRNYPLKEMPGWENGSIAWHCDDGNLYVESDNPNPKQPCTPCQVYVGDVIGCGIDFDASRRMSSDRQPENDESEASHVNKVEVFFTYNGKRIIKETVAQPEGGLFPTVGMQNPNEIVEINLSAVPPTAPVSRAERVHIEGEGTIVSFASNPYDDVGGIQLTQRNMNELRYFEVTIISTGEQSAIGIGIASSKYPLDCQPGWDDESFAYHCDDGRLFYNGRDKPRLCSSVAKDIIGCGIRNTDNQLQVFFTHNGEEIDREPFNMQPTELYPTVCMHSEGEKVKINVLAHWDDSPENRLFSRRKRIEIDGNKASYEPNGDTEVGTVQLSREISEEYPYFEVEVTDFGEDGCIGVGLAPNDYPLDQEPGWLPGSVGYHCDDGCLFEGVSWKGKRIREPGSKDDRLGCGLIEKKGDKVIVFFTHNDKVCQAELKRPSKGGLFPTIGMHSKGETITVIKDANWPRVSSRSPTNSESAREERGQDNEHELKQLL